MYIYISFFISSLVSVLLCLFVFLSEEWKNSRPCSRELLRGGTGWGGCQFYWPTTWAPERGGGGGWTLKWSDLVYAWGECGPSLFVCLFVCLCFDGGKGRAKTLATGLNFNIKYRPHYKVHKVCIIYSNLWRVQRTWALTKSTAQML